MLNKLLKLIGAQPEEKSQVLLLLANGFFMGIFLATYKVAAEAIFLSTFKGDYLEEAFVAAGFLGVISTFLFARLQNIIKYSTLAVVNLVVLALISGTIWFLFRNYNGEYLVFAAFAFLGPITAVVLLGFWGVFNRMFNLRQAKRIIGGIDTGQLSATILAFFSIPLLVSYFEFPSENLFLISSISILIALLFLIRIVTKHNLDKMKTRTKEEIRESKFIKMFKNKYIVLLSVFVLISIVILKFVDYSFLSVVQLQFPTEGSLTSFIAAINGMIMVLSFLIQTFVNDKIIGDYGLKVSLLVMPVILLIFSILAAIVHITGGSDISDSSFWMFFLFISLSKLFTTSLKDALENPAFKLYFMPLDIKVRFDIQTKIEGVIGEFSGLIAGTMTLIMALIGLKLIHYSYVTIILAFIVLFVVGKLYAEYRNALKSKLSVPGADVALNRTDQSIPFILQKGAKSKSTSKIINALEIMERLEPLMMENSLNRIIKGKDEETIAYAIKKLGYLNHLASLPVLEQAKNAYSGTLSELANSLEVSMKELRKAGNSALQIGELASSTKASNRVLCLRLIEADNDPVFYSHIHSLLRDSHPLVRINALITASKLREREFWPAIIDNLSNPTYTNTAMVCLVHLGEPVLKELEVSFNKTGQKLNTLSRIIRIYGRIGGTLATELLWKKADFPEPHITAQVFSALSQSGYQATSNYRGRIKNAIEDDISMIAWNISAFDELPKDQLGKMVRAALVEENESLYKHIYMLLAMNHEDLSVKLARENIESGNSEDLTYAIELLDLFLDDDLKPKLFPIVDDLPIPERIKRLQVFFPRDSFSEYEVLNQIVNRDYNKLNKWTKACAIYQLGHHKNSEVSDVLIANIFNPDPLLRETAAWAIHQIDRNAYDTHMQRLDPVVKRQLDDVMERHSMMDRYALLFHKVMLLKKMKLFTSVPSDILSKLVLLMKQITFEAGENIIREGRYKISSFYIIETGKVRITDGFNHELFLGSGQFFGASLLLDPSEETYYVEALEDVNLYRIGREEFYSFLSRNHQVIERLLEVERIMGQEPSLVE